MQSRGLRIALSLLFSLVFLYAAASGVDWGEAWRAMSAANYGWLVPIIAVTVAQIYLRALRWRVLLKPLGPPSLRAITAANNIGFMANFVLPLRAGEVIRPVLLSRKENVPLGGILATNVLERIFDMFTILLLFGVTVAFLPVSEQTRTLGALLVPVALGVAVVVAVIRWQEPLAAKVLAAVTSPLPAKVSEALKGFFDGFVQALRVLDSPRAFLELIAWSLLIWIVVSFIFGFGLLMFDLPAFFPLGQICVSAIVAVAVSVPSAPGFLGAFQLGCTMSLALLGVAESQALAYGLVIHVTQFIAVIGVGLYSLAREGLSFRQMEEVARDDAQGA